MVAGFGGRVRFVVENYGDSDLAKRFGVTRYPAIFVDDVLVATPKDFGFYGKGEGDENGRYAPWLDAKSHERFRGDLTRMLTRVLGAGGKAIATETTPTASTGPKAPAEAISPERLPPFALADLVDPGARPIESSALGGKVVLVEFWATWCPPCRGVLAKLGELQKRFGDRLQVVALAVDSDAGEVRKVAAGLGLPFRWGMSTPEIARTFGDLSAVPTLFLFGADGATREIFYGAPPDLHARLEQALARELGAP